MLVHIFSRPDGLFNYHVVMVETDKQRQARAKFLALRTSPPNSWDERAVSEFHEIISLLEEAYTINLSSFRIPDAEMKRKTVGVSRIGYSGRRRPPQMSDKRFCDETFVRRRIDGIMSYFDNFPPQSQPPKQGVQGNAMRLLKAIYDGTSGQSDPIDDITKLDIGLTEEESRAAFRYLSDKHLVQRFALPDAARINANGIDAIEKARSHPDQGTSGFPSVTYNTVYVSGNMVNSPLQQAGTHSTQKNTLTHSSQERSDLERLVGELTSHLNELNIDAHQKQRAEAQIATLKAQLTDEPDPVIVKQAGRTLRNITEGAIGSLLAGAVQPTVWHWIQQMLASF
jgi:hypothetical protein